MKLFAYHVVLDRENICNYKKEQKLLVEEVLRGQRLVVYGRRNTGKTSLVQSVVIPEYRKVHRNGLVIYVDFMGVRNLGQISGRIRISFQDALSEAFPKKALFESIIKLIKGLRPQLSVDPITGDMNFSIGVAVDGEEIVFEQLLQEIGRIHKRTKALLVFDEFQDIAFVEEAEAKLRNSLQQLPSDLPVIIMGSKKHLLSRMIAEPSAPFANWGVPIELPVILVSDYHRYINERFSISGLRISQEDTEYLMRTVQNIPECINLVCYMIQSLCKRPQAVNQGVIQTAIKEILKRFHSNFMEVLSKLTVAEEDFLRAMAWNQPVLQPRGHDFVKQLKSSATGSRKILKRFENDAVIYRLEDGYVLADPLLALFLKEKT